MVLMQRQTSSSSNASIGIGCGGDDPYGTPSIRNQQDQKGFNGYNVKRASSVTSVKQQFRAPGSRTFQPPLPTSFNRNAMDIESSNPYGAKEGQSTWKGSKGGLVLLLINFIAIGLLGFLSHSSYSSLRTTVHEFSELKMDFTHLQHLLQETEEELDSAHEEFHELKMTVLASQGERAKSEVTEFSEMTYEDRSMIAESIVDKHDAQCERISALQKSIQNFHKAELVRRFGEPPYHVEFTILLNGAKRFFTVEAATSMPHSTYYFLDMVDSGLWDMTVFAHRWNHVVQSAPIGPGGRSKRESMKGTLAFPEYDEKYKHEIYTLGFAGRPGGPEFYINLEDNSKLHGPGMQENSSVLNDADPCFAKVVIGTQVIDQLKKVSLETVTKNKIDGNGEEKEAFVFTTIESAKRIKLKQLPTLE